MGKSIKSVFFVFVFLTVIVSGCAPAVTKEAAATEEASAPTALPATEAEVAETATLEPTPTVEAPPTSASTAGTIEGHVFQTDPDRSFSGANVALHDANVNPEDPAWQVATTTTDADGNYVFDDVAPGKYTLSVTVWIEQESDMPCSIMLMQSTADQQWLLVTITDNSGKQGVLASQTHVEDNSWVPTVFDVAAGDVVQMDADLSC